MRIIEPRKEEAGPEATAQRLQPGAVCPVKNSQETFAARRVSKVSGNNSAEERAEGALSFSAALGVFVVQAEPASACALAWQFKKGTWNLRFPGSLLKLLAAAAWPR
ncbi:MAG: hypothetical protein LBU18_07550 [Treponema sp.]|nr:hypothetical protein [Treponema sp.]